MFRLLGWIFAFLSALLLVAVVAAAIYINVLTQDLPNTAVLKDYHPPVTTRVEAADGTLLAEYARENRLFQPIDTMPPLLLDAFISAEDKDFYTNHGISPDGIIRAIRDNVMHYLAGDRGPLVGASTITQQVAKNFFLTPDQSTERKVKEAILALRIDSTFSKDKILELYLNEIFMGSINNNKVYGVTSAALNYFNKALYQLDLSEIAYLAGLPKGPNNYNPFRSPKAAIERRNYVLDQMLANGYITRAAHDTAEAEPLDVTPRPSGVQVYSAAYFTEEVRRELAQGYGDDQLYGGGLSVRTTLDPTLQQEARKALMDGLVDYDRKTGFRGPLTHVDIGKDWAGAVYAVPPLGDVPEWTLAVVLSTDKSGPTIGLRPGTDAYGNRLADKTVAALANMDSGWVKKPLSRVLQPGDVVYVAPVDGKAGAYQLEQVPEIEGALVAMDPHTGRVEALVGGFSYAESQFNRATQALRQPGSSFKPIVYSAALDNGYTPASVVLDAPIEIKNADGTVWKPENYEKDYLGPRTLRTAIELSRNIMTVRLAQDIGMPLIAHYAETLGIYSHLQPVLAMALGAGETTDLRMTAAYATIANQGRLVTPTLIDRIQDRYGTTIYRHDQRLCDGCNVSQWANQPVPQIIDPGQQVFSPMTAYQITSMMEGVVQRGTGTYAKALNRPVAGKTGTSSDFRDAWFIGFTPQLVCGVYIGFDTPRNIGNGQTGGALAVPVFTEFMQAALKGQPPTPFDMPAGMDAQWIDETTGMAAPQGDQQAILEAFKPGTGPNLQSAMIGVGGQPGNAGDTQTAQQPGPDYGDPGIRSYRQQDDEDDDEGNPFLDLPPPSLTQGY